MRTMKKRIHLSFLPKGGRLLRLSRATSTGIFGMGTGGSWVGTERLILDPALILDLCLNHDVMVWGNL
jgi:hypothetical protein